MNAILTSSDRCNTRRFSVNRNKEHVDVVKVKLIEGNIYMYRRWNSPLLVFILISLASSRSKFACTPSQATRIFCRHSVANTLVGHLLMNNKMYNLIEQPKTNIKPKYNYIHCVLHVIIEKIACVILLRRCTWEPQWGGWHLAGWPWTPALRLPLHHHHPSPCCPGDHSLTAQCCQSLQQRQLTVSVCLFLFQSTTLIRGYIKF